MVVAETLGAPPVTRRPQRSAYWGTTIPDGKDRLTAAVTPWQPLVHFRYIGEEGEALEELAARLANDDIIGVARGRAEFGPRALGNRSILADPRLESSRDRVNAVIKEREGYRPFAPVVTAEAAADYFALTGHPEDHSFMSFAVPVLEHRRPGLQAVTHVDGTARLQTVTRRQNPWLWRLLNEFERHAGVPILLNTSFNVSAEPIVDSAEDAIVCLLTSGLSALVLGDMLVTPRPDASARDLALTLAPGVALRAYPAVGRGEYQRYLEKAGPRRTRRPISGSMWNLLSNGQPTSVTYFTRDYPDTSAVPDLLDEAMTLWRQRMISARP